MARHQRFVDLNGRPSIRAIGLPTAFAKDLYHSILTLSWTAFIALAFAAFALINAFFAGLYLLDPGGVENTAPGSYADAYFFSVESMMTIGYGRMVPVSMFAHVLVTLEAFVGVLFTALLTGVAFARFAVPTANVLFSDVVCLANHDGFPCMMFRLANARGNRIVEANVSVTLAKTGTTVEGETFRRIHDVTLVRSSTPLFWIGWTVFHRIDRESPFYGETEASLTAKLAEIVVVLSGVDEHSSSSVHTRRSYAPTDLRYGERFVDLLQVDRETGERLVDFARFHATQAAPWTPPDATDSVSG